METPAHDLRGLTPAEVAERVAAGLSNASAEGSGRTLAQILRANVFTRFNAILGSLFVVVAVVGPVQDGLFGVVLAVNTLIGVAQEIRAKRTLDRLAVLTAPTARVVRDGAIVERAVTDVVVDDVVELRPGDQVVVDAEVARTDGLELDESLLTGEVVPVAKAEGDEVLSGSFVVAGTGTVVARRVGASAFAQQLQGDARRFSLIRSELQQGTNQILRLVTWVMVPAGALLVVSQLVRSGQSVDEALRSSVAGVGAMVPEGLVLLTSLAFALGAIRLAARRVLVQELAAIEGLARVDVLCIDKTGTLTEPGMQVGEVEPLGVPGAEDALVAMAASDPSPNATMRALATGDHAPAGWHVTGRTPFSSARKWSAVEFGERGSWVLGSPELVLAAGLSPSLAERIGRHTAEGRRVLLLACSERSLVGTALPEGLVPAALVSLEERVRPDAPDTVRYLLDQGVTVKVLSGDDPRTVAAIARRVGIPGAEHPVDAATLPDEPEALAEQLSSNAVFGRIQPHQKRAVVDALQADGHVVAMTGDGVNDVPALKHADLSIGMGSGSQATKSVARIVLLDSAFSAVPALLGEGRRVIANIERVANLFVTKTVYASLLAVTVGIAAVPFPFYPRHLTLVSSLTIGIPGFFLALSAGAPLAHPGFVRRVLAFTVPGGLVAATVTYASYVVARGPFHAGPLQSRTAATLALLAVGFCVLLLVARPLNLVRLALVGAMAALAVAAWALPLSRRIFGLATPPAGAVAAIAVIVGLAAPALWLLTTLGTGVVARREAGSSPGAGGPPRNAFVAEAPRGRSWVGGRTRTLRGPARSRGAGPPGGGLH